MLYIKFQANLGYNVISILRKFNKIKMNNIGDKKHLEK